MCKYSERMKKMVIVLVGAKQFIGNAYKKVILSMEDMLKIKTLIFRL